MKLLLIGSSIFLHVMSFAQPGDYPKYEPTKHCWVYKSENGKYGLASGSDFKNHPRLTYTLDYEGKGMQKITEPIYDEIRFHEYTGFLILRKDTLYGFASLKGEYIVEPKFSSLRAFYWKYEKDPKFMYASIGEEWGLINITETNPGSWVIEPKYQQYNLSYREGFLIARLSDSEGNCNFGVIDTSGNIIIPFQQCYNIEFVYSHWNPNRGEGLSFSVGSSNGRVAWYSVQGKQFTDYKYRDITILEYPFALVELYPMHYGIIDTTGKEIIQCEYGYLGMTNTRKKSDTLAVGYKGFDKYYFDYKGNILLVQPMSDSEKEAWKGKLDQFNEEYGKYDKDFYLQDCDELIGLGSKRWYKGKYLFRESGMYNCGALFDGRIHMKDTSNYFLGKLIFEDGVFKRSDQSEKFWDVKEVGEYRDSSLWNGTIHLQGKQKSISLTLVIKEGLLSAIKDETDEFLYDPE